MLRIYLISLALLLGTVSAHAQTVNPVIPPSDTESAPEVTGADYLIYTASIEFPLSQQTASKWIYGGFKVLAARGQTEHFETPVDVVNLSGQWAQEGSVRRIEYADGHFSLEKALVAKPYYFKSQNWAMTKPERQGLNYTLNEYSLTPVSNNSSRFSWTIYIKPNDDYALSGTRRAAEEGLQQWMDDTLYQMFSMACSEYGIDPNING